MESKSLWKTPVFVVLLKSLFDALVLWTQRNGAFDTKSNFRIHISLLHDGVNILYFKLKILDMYKSQVENEISYRQTSCCKDRNQEIRDSDKDSIQTRLDLKKEDWTAN